MFKNELRKIIRPCFESEPKYEKSRFPSLAIYGKSIELTDNGKVISSHKYKYSGNSSEVVFFNNFVGYVVGQEKVTAGVKEDVESEYDKKGDIKGKCEHVYTVSRGRYLR